MMVASDGAVILVGERIAPAAQEWLARRGEVRIHSLHQSAVNLIDEQAEVCSIVVPPLGPGPFALLTRPAPAGFAAAGGFAGLLGPGTAVHKVPGALKIGRIRVELHDLEAWNPRPDWAGLRGSVTAAVIEELGGLLERHAPPGSLAPLAGGGRGPSARPTDPRDGRAPAPEARAQPELPEVLLRTLAERAEEFLSGMASSDQAEIERTAGQLAGLGGGVTPAGDDFLLGAIHALWLTCDPDAAQALSQAIVAQAAPRTHSVSTAWLRAAGRGEAAHEWHQLFAAIGQRAALESAAGVLIQRGHTSGADSLAGFLAAWRTLTAEPHLAPRLSSPD